MSFSRENGHSDPKKCKISKFSDSLGGGTVSVIIPAYNVEPYLYKCLDSILAQTYPNLEIILVDDGSMDGSGTICDEYAQKDERVTVIHKPNGGVSSARNAGLDAATGEYIAFVDADDVVVQNYFEILLADAQKYNADIVNCNCIELENGYDGTLGDWFKTTKSARLIEERETYFRDYLRSDDWYGTVVWGKIIKRNLALSVRFENINYNEDKLYMMRLFAKGPITYLDTYKGYCYIRWETSASMQANAGVRGRNLERARDGVYIAQQQLSIVEHFDEKEMICEYAKRYAGSIYGYIHSLIEADAHEEYAAERPRMVEYAKKCFQYKRIGLKCRLMLRIYSLNGSLYWNSVKTAWSIKVNCTPCQGHFELV